MIRSLAMGVKCGEDNTRMVRIPARLGRIGKKDLRKKMIEDKYQYSWYSWSWLSSNPRLPNIPVFLVIQILIILSILTILVILVFLVLFLRKICSWRW